MLSDTPLISVIITAYNAADFLDNAIKSVLAQTYKNFELILVNDGSKDNTLDIMKRYQTQDERVVVMDMSKNVGICAANNVAIKAAKGELIAKLDSDDVMFPNRLEEQVKFLKDNPKTTVLSSWVEYINEKGESFGWVAKYTDFTKPEDSEIYLKNNYQAICSHTSMITYKKSLEEIGGYREDIPCLVDWDLYNRLIEAHNILIIQQKTLTYYRLNSNSVMAKNMKTTRLQKNMLWVKDSLIKRRSGQKELTFEEYQAQVLDKLPFFTKLSMRVKFLFSYYNRKTKVCYINGLYGSFIKYCFLCFMLNPIFFLKKNFNRIPIVLGALFKSKKVNL